MKIISQIVIFFRCCCCCCFFRKGRQEGREHQEGQQEEGEGVQDRRQVAKKIEIDFGPNSKNRFWAKFSKIFVQK